MQFITLALLSIISLVSLVPSALAVQCGKWYSTKCLADEDKRYDEDYPKDIVYQNNIWEDFSSYWILTEDLTTKTVIHSSRLLSTREISADLLAGVPYTRSERKKFYNNTIVGSRLYEHSYSM